LTEGIKEAGVKTEKIDLSKLKIKTALVAGIVG
jgi:multimeric flavodoxin WrbA